MDLEQKAKDSRRVANHFYKEDCEYELATSRYYYSCFQKLSFFSTEKLNYERAKDKGTHESLIYFIDSYINDVLSEKVDYSILARTKGIKTEYEKLKKLRVKADYHNERITKEELDEAKRRVENFDKKLSEIKNSVRG